MTVTELRQELFSLRDEKYAQFQSKLIPNVPQEYYIGVRTPELRRLAKRLVKDEVWGDFIKAVPHTYFDENQLHAFGISENRDFSACIQQVDEFLGYVDNWATCDQLSPVCFKKHKGELLPHIRRWMDEGKTYTVRFGIGMLMQYFLDGDFQPEYLQWTAEVHSEEYYVRMMQAWYFATALAKQWDSTLPVLTERRLEPWVHNKTIQKAVESSRITPEQKVYLKTLKR